jgi:hypothetical protein
MATTMLLHGLYALLHGTIAGKGQANIGRNPKNTGNRARGGGRRYGRGPLVMTMTSQMTPYSQVGLAGGQNGHGQRDAGGGLQSRRQRMGDLQLLTLLLVGSRGARTMGDLIKLSMSL